MKKESNTKKNRKRLDPMRYVIIGIGVIFLVSIFYFVSKQNMFSYEKSGKEYVEIDAVQDDFDKIENGIHVRTGFVEGTGLTQVIQNCTNCHSSKLVIQNRMTKEQWSVTIRWMQETQNLWDLGDNEELIINYLATNYAPSDKGRRQNLSDIMWYDLEDE